MMDERKLDINAPLMSVRRSSAASPSLTEAKRKVSEKRHTLPYHKSDMTLEQVTEPVAVPFNWEHIPGRPKGNDGSQPQPPKESSVTPSPSLPPGKSTAAAKQPLQKECNGASKFRSSNKSNSLSGSTSKIDCDKERKVEKIRSNVEDDGDDDDEAYSDALDTLSSTESISMKCSASGVSGLDNFDANKSGTNATDKQTHDFMMSRFLPAAKAMTFHPPQYASSRKQSVLAEQPRDALRLVREERKSIVNKHVADIVPYTGQCQEEEEEEEEEESDDEASDYDESENVSAKGCGMFSRVRVRNSLCLLNPVPGMKVRDQLAMSSAYEYGKPNKSSHTPAIKKAWDAIHKSRSSSGAASPDMHEVRKKWTSESNRFTYSGEMKQLGSGRLSPFRRSRTTAAAGTSSFQIKPQPLIPRAKLHCDSKLAENNQSGRLRFPSRGHGNIQEVPSQRSSNSGSLAIEKRLYIDTLSTAKLSCSNTCSVDSTRSKGTMVALLDKREGKERSSVDTKNLRASGENLDSEELATDQEAKAERLTTDREINQESMSMQLVPRSIDNDTEINNNRQIVVVDHPGKVGAEFVVSPLLPPPLPKSPSDSWLSRALPLVYMKNSFPHSNHETQSLAKRQSFNASSRYLKWETIVKNSNLHHGHAHRSQELTIYKPHHSKS